MSTSRKPKAAAKPAQTLNFLTPVKGESTTKPVSARVDADLYNRFQAASERVKAHGYEISITRVIERAFKAAIDEADAMCGHDAQQELSLGQ